jgi:uncharacterized protein YdiU (UPF0061 family)
MRAKLGLDALEDGGAEADAALADDWLGVLQANKVDFTLASRRLADAAEGTEAPLRALFGEHQALDDWMLRWQARCAAEDARLEIGAAQDHGEARAERMRRVNPWLIPRNHRVEEALDEASERGNLEPFEQLLAALSSPYEERPDLARYAEPAPQAFMQTFRTFCGT